MISATSSPHSLSKPAQIPLGLENGRLRVDSQKFLVPSLPVSSRVLSNDPSSKRRERSILNGTAHPSENHNGSTTNHINGLRRSYNGSQLHQPQLHTSPRKDAQSPLYNGESNNVCTGMPLTNPTNFSVRSSMPIPCSSPSPTSSASPNNKSHSPSSGSSSLLSQNNGNGYSPQLPPGLSEYAASRLYPGGFHGIAPHPTAHLSPFYAAAAASHSIPYPIFGAHSYNHLDNFHSNLLTIPQMRSSPSPSPPRPPPSSYLPSPQQQSQHSPHLPQGPQTTSTTSLHSQLIESVGAGERYNGHNHNHMNNHLQPQHHHHSHSHTNNNNNITSSNNNSRFSNGGPGVSNGSATNLPPPSSPSQQQSRIVDNSSDKSFTTNHISNGSRNKVWIDLPSPKNSVGGVMVNGNVSHQHQQHMKEMEMESMKDAMKGKEGSLKHYILTRSPDQLSSTPNGVKNHKNHNFIQSPPNGLHHHQSISSLNSESSPGGIDTKFLPPSPKKRKDGAGQWNFAVPNSKTDLPPPPSSSSPGSLNGPSLNGGGGVGDSSFKYLSNNTKNPSNNVLTSNNSNNHDSPKSPYLMTCSSPSSNSVAHSSPHSSPSFHAAQQFHFQFPNLKSTALSSNSNSPQSTPNCGNQSPATKTSEYMSAPSTPTLVSINNNIIHKSKSVTYKNTNPPIQVEQMPLIDAFRRGSLTQLPCGRRKPVEDLSADDFVQAAAVLSDSMSIVHCTVVHMESNQSFCKVTMSTGSHNQQCHQIQIQANLEQPFFVLGRGWSSSSPAKTEKKLQLSCTPLCVGDVCITLTRTPNPVPKTGTVKVTSGKGTSFPCHSGHNNSPKSRTSGGGIHGHVTANSKSSSSNVPNSKSSRRQANPKPSLPNGHPPNTNTMPPPPLPPQNFYNSNVHQQQQCQQNQNGQPLSLTVSKASPPMMTNENDRPSSPKKRRWSAPDK